MGREIRIFPPGLVGADGRRLRLGSKVSPAAEPHRTGEITGWAGSQRGLEVFFSADDTVETLRPDLLVRVDDELLDPVTVGWMAVDDDPRPVLLIVPLGTRDLVTRNSDPGPFTESDRSQPRHWSSFASETLNDLDPKERAALCAQHLDAPMLRRVLDEGSLPFAIKRLVFIGTNQHQPQATDTAGFAPLLRLWLEGRGHLTLGTPERLINEVADIVTIERLPHILDAVVHQVADGLKSVIDGCERAVILFAGGTPAMTYGITLAVSRLLPSTAIRIVQVPMDIQIQGDQIPQPLIEIDLIDTQMGTQIQ
jgi:hypothetical protein